jgi:hypothetical protein
LVYLTGTMHSRYTAAEIAGSSLSLLYSLGRRCKYQPPSIQRINTPEIGISLRSGSLPPPSCRSQPRISSFQDDPPACGSNPHNNKGHVLCSRSTIPLGNWTQPNQVKWQIKGSFSICVWNNKTPY